MHLLHSSLTGFGVRVSILTPECQDDGVSLLPSCPVPQHCHCLNDPKQAALRCQHELVALSDILLLPVQHMTCDL